MELLKSFHNKEDDFLIILACVAWLLGKGEGREGGGRGGGRERGGGGGGGGGRKEPSFRLPSAFPLPLPSPPLPYPPLLPFPSPPSSFKASYAGYNYSLLLTFYSFIFLCQCNQVDIFFILFYANTVTSVRMIKELIPFFDEFRILPFKQMAALTAEVT